MDMNKFKIIDQVHNRLENYIETRNDDIKAEIKKAYHESIEVFGTESRGAFIWYIYILLLQAVSTIDSLERKIDNDRKAIGRLHNKIDRLIEANDLLSGE